MMVRMEENKIKSADEEVNPEDYAGKFLPDPWEEENSGSTMDSSSESGESA